MNAILIARVSTEEQKEIGNSLPAQVARLERYCKNKDFRIIKTCSFDESAYSLDRTEFDKIIDFILSQKEKIAVCCDKVDRISRNIFDVRISKLYEKALKDEIELHFVSDNQVINSRISAAEKFQFSISLGLAKYYSDAVSDNVKRGLEQKVRKGEWLSRAPFAYRNIRHQDGTKDIVLDEHDALVVKEAFELYASGAYSMRLLVKKLNDKYNTKLSKAVLCTMLNNPFYYGEMMIKGEKYQHRYQTIIKRSLFDQVKNIIAGFKRQPVKYAGKPYFYRGLIRCAHCGLTVTPEKHKGHVYYHCTQSKGKHGAKWLREEVITEQLANVFKSLRIPDDILQQIVDTLNTVHEEKIKFHSMHFDRLIKEQKSVSKMMDNLYLDKLKNKINEDQYERFYKSFRDQLDDILLRLERLQDAEDNYYETAKSILSLSNRAHDIFMGSEVEERRQLIKFILLNLQLDGENLVYDVKKPFDLIVDCVERKAWCA